MVDSQPFVDQDVDAESIECWDVDQVSNESQSRVSSDIQLLFPLEHKNQFLYTIQLDWKMQLAINCNSVKIEMFSKFSAGLNIDTTLTKATMLYAQTENVKIVTCTKPKKIEYYLAVMSVALNKITSSLVTPCKLSTGQ